MPITREELDVAVDRVADRLYRQQAEGFAAVNARLDRINGSIVRHEVAIAEHRVKISTLNRQVFRRRRDDDPEDEALSIARAFTPREKGLIAGGVTVIFVLLEGVLKLGEFLIVLARAALKVKGA